MSIESKEIKDLHEIYQNLQEGPMSGAVLFDKKEKERLSVIKEEAFSKRKVKADAPVECKYLRSQPYSTSLIIYSTDANAPSPLG